MVKINYLIKTGLFLSVCFILSGCPSDDYQVAIFKIVNNSDRNILWTTAGDLKDLSEMENNPWITNGYGEVISNMLEVKKEVSYIKAGDSYEYFITEGHKETLKRRSIIYYFFDYDSVCVIPWKRIRDEHIILKEVVFTTWEEMEACNFEITYP